MPVRGTQQDITRLTYWTGRLEYFLGRASQFALLQKKQINKLEAVIKNYEAEKVAFEKEKEAVKKSWADLENELERYSFDVSNGVRDRINESGIDELLDDCEKCTPEALIKYAYYRFNIVAVHQTTIIAELELEELVDTFNKKHVI